MKKLFCNNRGEGHVNTALKIIIGIVIGALLLGGLYFLVSAEDGVMDKVDTEVQAMMEYEQELRMERAYNAETRTHYLRYSYDGKHWSNVQMPTYSETATVYGVLSNGSSTDCIHIALIQDGTQYYILASTDGGINWIEQMNFRADTISHFYYGTSDRLPSTSGSHAGEKFVIRYQSGQPWFTLRSDGLNWSNSGWSEFVYL